MFCNRIQRRQRKNLLFQFAAAKSVVLLSMGHRAEALKLAAEADRHATLREEPGMSVALNQLGIVYRRLGRLKQAAERVNRARRISEQARDLPETARALHNLGVFANDRGDYREALRYCSESLALQSAAARGRWLQIRSSACGQTSCDPVDRHRSRDRGDPGDPPRPRRGASYFSQETPGSLPRQRRCPACPSPAENTVGRVEG